MLGLRLCAAFLLGAVSFLPLADAAHAATLSIGGTGAALGTMTRLGEAFAGENPDIEVEVLPSLGSGGGIKALSAGAIDLAVSARALKPAEAEDGLNAQMYGITALVFATNSDVAQSEITRDEIVAIYRGDQTTWADGTPVRPVLRPSVETDIRLISAHIDGMAEAFKAAGQRTAIPVLTTDQQTADALERIPGALGPTTLSLLLSEGRALQTLALDGVMPDEASIADGSYPLTKTFYFVTRSEVTEPVNRFIAFTRSERGRQILRSNGHLIVTRMADQ